MWKLWIGAIVTSGLLVLGTSAAAWAASGGNLNAGDVWVDSSDVPAPAGPGHEMDPHLPCQDINLWGSGLADGSGTFTIAGWAPSGSQDTDYSGTWSYSQTSGRKSGSQIIAVISESKLISQAQANGDQAAAQGFHFKLQFAQDPQKHKTFWLDCSPASGGGGNSGGGDSGGGGNNSGGGNDNSGGGTNTNANGSNNTPSPGTTPAQITKTAIGAVTATRTQRHKTHKRRHRLLRPARHRRGHRRHLRAVRVRAPLFTG